MIYIIKVYFMCFYIFLNFLSLLYRKYFQKGFGIIKMLDFFPEFSFVSFINADNLFIIRTFLRT